MLRRLRAPAIAGALASAVFLAAPSVLPRIAAANPTREAGAPPPRDVAAAIETVRAKHVVPAMAGAVVLGDGRVTAIGVAGARRAGSPERATLDDRWHLGSCTKAMTATLCARLVERKRLAWDDTVGEVFGCRTCRVPAMDAGWKSVSLSNLLHNRGGAPANLDEGGLWGRLWAFSGSPEDARLALVEGVLARPPVAPPGTKHVYSNAGFSIAGAMAEAKTQRAWEDLLRDEVFVPLGITTFGFGAPGTATKLDAPRGHRDSREGPVAVEPGKQADNPVAIGPAGIVHMTIRDWANFVAAHVSGERTGRFLPAAAWKRLHEPEDGDDARYAMGWAVTERPWGGRVLTHSGSNTMWFCVTWLSPSKDFAVLVTSNLGGDRASKACDEVAWSLIQDHLAHEGK